VTVPATAWKAGMRVTASRLLARNDQSGIVYADLPTNDVSEVITVTFDEPFPYPPIVQCGIASGSGVTGRFEARPINISTTGFSVFVLLTDAAETNPEGWIDQPVHWFATV